MAELRISPELALPLDLITQTTGIFARKGAGKTYTAKRIVEEVVKARLPVVVLDPLGAWWGLRSSADGQSPGLPVVILGGEHGDVPLEPTAGALIADVVIEHPGAYVLDLSDFGSDAEQDRFATAFMQRLYRGKARNRDPLLLVVDEADAFAPQQGVPGQQVMIGAAKTIARRARLRGLGSMWITQRPAILHADIRAMVELLILLQVTGSHDRIAIDAWLKGKGSDEDRATVIESLARLPVGEMWASSPAWLGLLVRTKASPTETFDSSKTPEVGEERVEPRAFATVDLSALGEQIAATAEQAKANDPKELRKEIAALQRQLSERPTEVERVVVEERVVEIEVPVLNGEVEALREAVTLLVEVSGPIVHVGEQIIAAIDRVGNRPTPPPPRREEAPTMGVGAQRPAPRPLPERSPSPTTPTDPPDGLSTYAQALLATFASRHPMRMSKGQLALLSGRSARSSAFAPALLQLLRAGYVEGGSSDLAITSAGFAALGGEAPAPSTPEEIRATWRRALPTNAARIFDVLIDAHPEALTREDIAERTGYSLRSSAFAPALSLLRKSGLTTTDADGIRAHEDLF